MVNIRVLFVITWRAFLFFRFQTLNKFWNRSIKPQFKSGFFFLPNRNCVFVVGSLLLGGSVMFLTQLGRRYFFWNFIHSNIFYYRNMYYKTYIMNITWLDWTRDSPIKKSNETVIWHSHPMISNNLPSVS